MTSPTNPHWLPTRAAADALGLSERTLHRWRAIGLLKPGRHWRRKFPSGNSPLLYDMAAVETAMREASARTPAGLEIA